MPRSDTRSVFLATLFYLFVIVPHPGWAQDSYDCGEVLVADLVQLELNEEEKLHLFRILTESTASKVDIESGGSYGVISGFLNKTDEERRDYLRSEKYQYDRHYAASFLSLKVPSESRTAWLECVRIQSKKAPGLYLLTKRADATSAEVVLRWQAPPGRSRGWWDRLLGGEQEGLTIEIDPEDTTLVGAQVLGDVPEGRLIGKPIQLVGNGEHPIVLTRTAGAMVMGSVSKEGYGDTFHLPGKEDRPVEDPPPPMPRAPVYGLVTEDYRFCYTTDPLDARLGWSVLAVAFHATSEGAPGAVAVTEYWMQKPEHSFVYVAEGQQPPSGFEPRRLAFHAFTSQVEGSVPVYEFSAEGRSGPFLRYPKYRYSLDPAGGYGWVNRGAKFYAFAPR